MGKFLGSAHNSAIHGKLESLLVTVQRTKIFCLKDKVKGAMI